MKRKSARANTSLQLCVSAFSSISNTRPWTMLRQRQLSFFETKYFHALSASCAAVAERDPFYGTPF